MSAGGGAAADAAAEAAAEELLLQEQAEKEAEEEKAAKAAAKKAAKKKVGLNGTHTCVSWTASHLHAPRTPPKMLHVPSSLHLEALPALQYRYVCVSGLVLKDPSSDVSLECAFLAIAFCFLGHQLMTVDVWTAPGCELGRHSLVHTVSVNDMVQDDNANYMTCC